MQACLNGRCCVDTTGKMFADVKKLQQAYMRLSINIAGDDNNNLIHRKKLYLYFWLYAKMSDCQSLEIKLLIIFI